MPWSSGYESQRSNLTSLLGTLAQLSEGKKNRRAQLLSDILGIGSQFGGAALQNKWGKEAASTAYGREQESAETQFNRDLLGRGFASPEEVRISRKAVEERESKFPGGEASRIAQIQELARALGGDMDKASQLLGFFQFPPSSGTREEGKPPFTPTDYVSAKWLGYLETPAAQRRGLVDRTGVVDVSKIDDAVMKEFIQQSFEDARATAQESGISLALPMWESAVKNFIGEIKKPDLGEDDTDKSSKKAEKEKARAEERQQRESLLTQVQTVLREVNNIPNGRSSQPALSINSGMMNLYTQNSSSLARLLEQLQAVKEQLSNTPAAPENPLEDQMQQLLKAGVPGLPKAPPSQGSPMPNVDLSKIRW